MLVVDNFLSARRFSKSVSETLADRLEGRGWPIIRASSVVNRPLRLADMLSVAWRKRREYDVACVAVYSGFAFLWSEAVAYLVRALRKPCILRLYGGNLPQFGRKWPNRVRRLLRAGAVVTTDSEYLRSAMVPFREDIRLIPNAIDIGAYPYVHRTRARPALVWIRAFHKIYNPELAPRLLHMIEDDYPGATLTMIGPDKGDGSLMRTRAEAERMGVLNRVRFIPGIAHTEVPRALQKGDIFLNTTTVESFGMCVLEAMACGLCVVTTDAGGLPYWVEHGTDAIVVPRNDSLQMASAVRAILADAALAERLSHNARRKAEQYDWAAILSRWESVLRSVVAGTPPRSAAKIARM